MSLAYRIIGGAVQPIEIPAEGLPVMLSRADLHPRLLLPGQEDEHWPSLLPVVAEISARVAPWAT